MNKIYFTDREVMILEEYINDMITLFNLELDKDENLKSERHNLYYNKNDFINLKEKLKIKFHIT